MNSSLDRRFILAAGISTVVPSLALAAENAGSYRPPYADRVPLGAPGTELAWEAFVEIAPIVDLGDSPLGRRRMVPITGGTFEGPRLRGKVLPGGADRQLVRKDGVTVLNALYELQTDDGAIITVLNRVTSDRSVAAAPYTRSLIEVTAPEGAHAWLNRAAFVGTLNPLAGKAVLIRVYKLI